MQISEIPFQQSYVFYHNFMSDKKIVVNQGGTSSGKTYSLLQLLVCRALEEAGQVITVVGQDIPNLKKGAHRDFVRIWRSHPFFENAIVKENKSERIFTFVNGSILEFVSYGDAQDAKNGKRDYLFVNEANGVDYEVFEELAVRTSKQIFLDFNPTREFWVHQHLLNKPSVETIISNYTHNPDLDPSIRQKIEAYRHTDPNRWRVYGLGLTGMVEHTIYKNWKIKSADNKGSEYVLGLDFGFNNPSAMVEVGIDGRDVFVKELLYETGLTEVGLLAKIEGMEVNKMTPIYADAASPDKIDALYRQGYNVHSADKKVKAGIDFVQSMNLFIDPKSENLIRELKNYCYQKDKNGNILEEPIKDNDHALDALRYALYSHLKSREMGDNPKYYGLKNVEVVHNVEVLKKVVLVVKMETEGYINAGVFSVENERIVVHQIFTVKTNFTDLAELIFNHHFTKIDEVVYYRLPLNDRKKMGVRKRKLKDFIELLFNKKMITTTHFNSKIVGVKKQFLVKKKLLELIDNQQFEVTTEAHSLAIDLMNVGKGSDGSKKYITNQNSGNITDLLDTLIINHCSL